MGNQFGTIISGDLVEQAAMDTIKLWIGAYLRELERQSGRPVGKIPKPRSMTTLNQFSRVNLADQTPSLVVVSPGLAEDPSGKGDGGFTAKWAFGFAIIVSAKDQEATNSLCKLYTAAIRAVILQKSSLGGFARGTTWVDEKYDDLPPEESRTLAVGQGLFTVEVADVVNWQLGPRTVPDPETEDPGDWPTAETVQADVVIEQ